MSSTKKLKKEEKNTPVKDDASSEGEDTEEQDEEIYRKLSTVFLKLEDKGLPVKNAVYGKSRADYARGDDLHKALKDNLEFLCKEIKTICDIEIDHTSETALQEVYEEFNLRSMMAKATKFKEDGKIKYPKRLNPYEEDLHGGDDGGDCCDKKHDDKKPHQSHSTVPYEQMKIFDEKMYYVLDIHRGKKQVYMWLIIAVVGVLMYALFPVWPDEVKIGIWWVSYILLNILLGILVVRLLLHGLLYTVGVDFWLFPNLLDDKAGVLDSFKPFMGLTRRIETIYTILIRVAITVTISYLAWEVYNNPKLLNDFGDSVIDAYVDVFDWGKDKMVGNSTAIDIKNAKYLNNPLLTGEDEY